MPGGANVSITPRACLQNARNGSRFHGRNGITCVVTLHKCRSGARKRLLCARKLDAFSGRRSAGSMPARSIRYRRTGREDGAIVAAARAVRHASARLAATSDRNRPTSSVAARPAARRSSARRNCRPAPDRRGFCRSSNSGCARRPRIAGDRIDKADRSDISGAPRAPNPGDSRHVAAMPAIRPDAARLEVHCQAV